MSQVHIEEIPLKALVNNARFIFIAEKTDNFNEKLEISVRRIFKKYPPFSYNKYHFKIIEILYSKEAGVTAGDEISVLPNDFNTKLDIHKRYYLEGAHKSPIYAEYKTSADFLKENKLILFLHRYDVGNFEFSAESAWESLSKKEEVLALINDKKLREAEYGYPCTEVKPR